MPFTDPASVQDPTTGVAISSSWGDTVNADLNYLASTRPRANVYNNANQSISNATSTALTFNSERFDPAGMHSTVSNTSRLTIPASEGGHYMVGCTFQFASNATGYRQGALLVNGSTVVAIFNTPAVSGVQTRISLCTLYPLAAGDYVEVQVYQTSGGALNVETSPVAQTLWAEWSGAT